MRCPAAHHSFSLSYFENMIRDAITTAAEPVRDDPETARWKARVRGWMQNPAFWRANTWGDPPHSYGCCAETDPGSVAGLNYRWNRKRRRISPVAAQSTRPNLHSGFTTFFELSVDTDPSAFSFVELRFSTLFPEIPS